MTRPAIVVEGLSKRYEKVVALDGLSLEVPAGSIAGLLGPNGSGKTNTVSVLSTALRPDGGRAQLHDHDVAIRELTLDDVFLTLTRSSVVATPDVGRTGPQMTESSRSGSPWP